MTAFFDREFGHGRGAFQYLSGLTNASDGLKLAVHASNVEVAKATRTLVYQGDGMTIYAFGIPHGDVPALAFRIETPKGVIVLSADQNGSRKEFINFAAGADILMMPAAIDDDADAQSRFLHATPTIVGKIAAAIKPKMLVLDHFMGRSLVNKDQNIRIIQQYYHGPVFAGRDLSASRFPPVEQEGDETMKVELALTIAATSLLATGAFAASQNVGGNVQASNTVTHNGGGGKCASGKCGTEKIYSKAKVTHDPNGQLVRARDGKCGLSGKGYKVAENDSSRLAEGVCGR